MIGAFDRYLYAIGMLKEKYLCVRAVDVAHCLGVSKASVSLAVRRLREQGLIVVEPDGNLCFTAPGRDRSDQLDRRVSFFRRFLTEAGVEPSQAVRDAIAFSWEMSEASFEAFRAMRAEQAREMSSDLYPDGKE